MDKMEKPTIEELELLDTLLLAQNFAIREYKKYHDTLELKYGAFDE